MSYDSLSTLGSFKKDLLFDNGRKVTRPMANKESNMYKKKDLDVFLKADISDTEESTLVSRVGTGQATAQRSSTQSLKRKA